MALFQEDPSQFLGQLDDIALRLRGLAKKDVEELVQQREQAREAKDFAKADEIRKKLDEMGIELHDGQLKRPWEVKAPS